MPSLSSGGLWLLTLTISNMTMLIGVVTSVIWILVILAVTQDMGAVQAASLPNIEVMYQATRSKSVATFLQSYMTLLYYSKLPHRPIPTL